MHAVPASAQLGSVADEVTPVDKPVPAAAQADLSNAESGGPTERAHGRRTCKKRDLDDEAPESAALRDQAIKGQKRKRHFQLELAAVPEVEEGSSAEGGAGEGSAGEGGHKVGRFELEEEEEVDKGGEGEGEGEGESEGESEGEGESEAPSVDDEAAAEEMERLLSMLSGVLEKGCWRSIDDVKVQVVNTTTVLCIFEHE